MNALLLAFLLLQDVSSIDGTVVHVVDQRPVAQTQIVAVPVGGLLKDSKVTASDSAGHFRIEGLLPGSYRLFFDHNGFVHAEYGQRAPGKAGVPIELAAGKNVTGISIPLTPTSAIVGRVVKNSNEPVVNATVRALKPAYQNGERTLEAVQSAQTDDRGEYRLFGLVPGNYFVSATPVARPFIQGGAVTTPSGNGFAGTSLQNVLTTGNLIDPRALEGGTELSVYAPNTTDANAAVAVDLRPDAELRMQDLRTVRAKSFSVRGQVVDEAGQAMAIDYAQLFQLGSGQSYRTSPLTQNRTTFEFVGVLPGVYQLKATGAPGATEKVGSLNVTLSNEDIENIRLVMGPAIEVKGRIVQEGGAVPSTIRVQLRSVNGSLGVQLNPTAADGSFTVTRLTPGDYRLIIFEMPANSYVRSAKIGTRDVSSLPLHIEGPITDQLDIVLAATTSSVDALVTDRGKQPVAAAIVVLVPNIERRQRFELYRTATTDATGRASLASIAPGNYKLFAWQDIEPNAWQNAAALAPFEERGVPITIIENGKVNQVITVID